MPFVTNSIIMTITPVIILWLTAVAVKVISDETQKDGTQVVAGTGVENTWGTPAQEDPYTADPGFTDGTGVAESDDMDNTGTTIQDDAIIRIEGVPFTSQAPYENWWDIMNEEWCEEASMLMAVYWSRGETFNSGIVNDEIKKISVFERDMFGAFHDTSLSDTAKVMDEYFSFSKYNVREDIEKSDMIESLKDGNILLVPLYGRDLQNPYYTPPGPVPHMIVVHWYDPVKKEFITHDPGTKSGEDLRFNEDILFNAMWMYPTTSEVKITPPNPDEVRRKGMIEVSK